MRLQTFTGATPLLSMRVVAALTLTVVVNGPLLKRYERDCYLGTCACCGRTLKFCLYTGSCLQPIRLPRAPGFNEYFFFSAENSFD